MPESTSPDLADLTSAAVEVLGDMETGQWRAIQVAYLDPGRVAVTLCRNADPIQCICVPPEGDNIDPECVACLDGQPEPDYLDVNVTIARAER
ncbi:hypothetical protein RB608_11880 [Nocardioides sp. LHD-245]|uniref:hypothetical protein n=1 Tax=Nocardioides sp. LHD-245 TaxID=3051387 RepID=UPI0027DEFD7E|nr:hypothetical protein [Nocardioides sp. LHD-245]